MKLKLLLIIILFWFVKPFAQFQFSGKVSNNFNNATAYLSVVEDCNKKDLFLTEFILQEIKIIDSNFIFKGDFLESDNRIYKIHIDNCNDEITDYKHLLNHCDDSKEILFIANNSDYIYFPLNNLSQEFCSIEQSSTANNAILKIDELQENILSNLQNSKSDRQRNTIFHNFFTELQSFSKQFKEPLAELYAYHLYANENSVSRDFYLKDLKKSDYYNDLLNRLEKKYKNTNYSNLYKNTLLKDQYPLIKSSYNRYKILTFTFGFLLFISLFYHIYKFNNTKNKAVAEEILDYKRILTSQEQKVFELMLKNSNKEIADKLFVSLSTIKSHINSIYSKLKINSRKEINPFLKD
jgi:DNA-binding CsgD family transcriptional regulator